MQLKAGAKVYFMGIGGTGMAAVAGLAQLAGYKVSGSDKGVYPPMSTMLQDLHIAVRVPYDAANLQQASPDLVVVANALSRGNPEVEALLTSGIPYVSFPQFLGDNFLKKRASIVVAGTHGKTTTTALCAFVLNHLGQQPGYMIGGLPKDLPLSFALGEGQTFVIEGDEYDTAFFDKGPKFLHYHPKYVILNNIEFDHADIYKNVDEIEAQFEKLCALMSNKRNIIANVDDAGVQRLLKRLGILEQVSKVSTGGRTPQGDVVVLESLAASDQTWTARMRTAAYGEVQINTPLAGDYNVANIAQCVGLLSRLAADNIIPQLPFTQIAAAIAQFNGVRRRLDLLARANNIDVFEDFAHHPTAIRLLIEAFRKKHPKRRLIIAFEPTNATGRRNILQNDFATSLALADLVFIGKCPEDLRIPEKERMSTRAMQELIGAKAEAFTENELLLSSLQKKLQPNDSVIFLSPGSFSGIQYKLSAALGFHA